MKSNLKSIVRSAVLAAGLLGAGGVFAHDHNGPNHRGYDYRGYDYDRGDDDGYYGQARVVRRPVEEFTYARVVDVDPIVHRVVAASPQRECWYEDREVYQQRGIDQRTATPTIVGAIIGGVIGHQFGSGYSRNVGTVAGAVLGASIGHDSAQRSGDTEVRSVQRCRVNDYPQYEQRVDGYRVTYIYRGREYTTVMPYDPGNRVQLRVGVNMTVVP